MWTCDLSAVTGTCCCWSCRAAAATSTAAFPAKEKAEMFFRIVGRNDWEKSKAGTSPLQWRRSPASHCPRLYPNPDTMGQVCRAQFFFPAPVLVRPPFPSDCSSDRLKAGGTAGIRRVTGPGWGSFLPQELLWHTPCPPRCCPAARAPSSSGMLPLTLCVSGQNVSFCRLLGTQRATTNKRGLGISHSRGCKCSL